MRARRIFLSFLGTNPYTKCNYVWKRQKIKNVNFIQDALVRIFCYDFDRDDRIIIFNTDRSEKENWLGQNRDYEGLKTILAKMDIDAKVETVKISAAKDENDIWKLFETVYGKIESDDSVILDITHAFRYIPMLAITLLNYAKFLKNIKIEGIYYGAFEVLGHFTDVEKLPLAERNAPIFDFTPLSEIQDWNTAVENFVNFGNPKKLNDIINRVARNFHKNRKNKTAEEKEYIKQLGRLKSPLNNFFDSMTTSRYLNIEKGNCFNDIRLALDNVKRQKVTHTTLKPLLQIIESKVSNFKQNTTRNGFIAVEWCIEHNLIQQGFTLLRETVLTYLLNQLSLPYKNKELRENLSSYLSVKYKKLPREEWSQHLKKCEYLDEFQLLKLTGDFLETYHEIRDARNEINHAGIPDNRKATNLADKLKKLYKRIESQLLDKKLRKN